MKKAILIVKKTYAFHRKTRNRQGYVVTYVFFDPIGNLKFLVVHEPKMLERRFIIFEYQCEEYPVFSNKYEIGRGKKDSAG
ncbi:hypothetical protein [Akkermansia sp.]|uniref:hypothetical protein n=1 Tax=Akkermansia sp. TaxID=1872421 RepID=UPI0025C015FB|nr:hypothetical protein [Akkermansia sp.]MCC8149387.1 hypothetical protein [Akkermansia sp.]